jgi:hypothetical protein
MRTRYLLYVIALSCCAGCAKSGQDVAPVTGRITLDGKPLESAMVTFHAEGKSAASSGTDKDGRYELVYKRGVMGAPVGPNRVTILPGPDPFPRDLVLPPRYNAESQLHADVKPDQKNEFNFDLTTDAK